MSVTAKCGYCGSDERPNSVMQEHDVATLVVLYCASCGAILAAADYNPRYSETGEGQSTLRTEAPR